MRIPFQFHRPKPKILDQEGIDTALEEDQKRIDKYLEETEEDIKQLLFRKTIGICPECRHHVRVNRNGNVGSHKIGITESTYCPGNGQKPLKIVAQYDY